MKCVICQQWNVPRVTRCIYCDNAIGSERDESLHGRPSYERVSNIDLPVVSIPMQGQLPEKRDGISVTLEKLLWFLFH